MVQSDVKLRLSMSIPSWVPIPKKTLEKQGSESLQNMIDSDVGPLVSLPAALTAARSGRQQLAATLRPHRRESPHPPRRRECPHPHMPLPFPPQVEEFRDKLVAWAEKTSIDGKLGSLISKPLDTKR